MKKRIFISALCAAVMITGVAAAALSMNSGETAPVVTKTDASMIKVDQEKETDPSQVKEDTPAPETKEAAPEKMEFVMIEKTNSNHNLDISSAEFHSAEDNIVSQNEALLDEYIGKIAASGEYDTDGIDLAIQQKLDVVETWEETYTIGAQQFLDEGHTSEYEQMMEKAKNPPSVDIEALRQELIDNRITTAAWDALHNKDLDIAVEITKRAGYAAKDKDGNYLTSKDFNDDCRSCLSFVVACCNTINDPDFEMTYEENVRLYCIIRDIYDVLRFSQFESAPHDAVVAVHDFIARTIPMHDYMKYEMA